MRCQASVLSSFRRMLGSPPVATVAVIGAGAIGSYYGARLAQAGHDVRFLLRHDYDAVAERGLRIESHHGDFALERPAIARDPAAIGTVDWVLCGLKTTALDDAAALIRLCLTPETRVLAIMNGLGGLAFTCINRGEPGVIHHIEYGQVGIAHLHDDPAELGRRPRAKVLRTCVSSIDTVEPDYDSPITSQSMWPSTIHTVSALHKTRFRCSIAPPARATVNASQATSQ